MKIELDVDGQKQIEMQEAFRISQNEQTVKAISIDLCDVCTKREDCMMGQLGDPVSECTDFGAPN